MANSTTQKERINLDRKDKQLLDLLYLNSRESFVQLGKKLKLSSASVERRLRQLQDAGIITLLFADVNFAKLGLKSYRIYMKFDVMDEQTEHELLKFFETYSRTVWGVICEGEYDVLIRFIAKDEFEVQKVIELVLKKFGTKITEKTVITTTYQNYLSWNRVFETERRAAFPVERMDKSENFDKVDMKILSALYENARTTTVEIAKKVGLSPDAIQYRLRKLNETGLILGYTAWFDSRKLGFDYYKLLIGFRNITTDKENEFLGYCAQKDEVVFVNKTIGSWDIELDILVRDNQDLHAFIRNIKTSFGDIMGRHTYISAIEERMLNPLRGE